MAMLAAALITAAVTGTCPNGWKRGFAKGGEQDQCFRPHSGNFGWSNKIYRGRSYSMPIYADAHGCDHRRGHVVGTMDITWPQSCKMQVTFRETTSESFKFIGFKVDTSHLPDNCGWTSYGTTQRTWIVTRNAYTNYIYGYVELCKPSNTPAPATPAPATPAPRTPAPVTPAPCTPALETSPEVTVTAGSTQRPSGNAVAANMLGWSIDNGAQVILDQFADVYKLPGMKAYFPEQDKALAAGAEISFECPENCEGRGCEVIVTTYHCVPCSSQSNGHLPALMTADGWEAGSCAPRFRQPSKRHQMVAFRTFVAAGGSVTTPATEKPLSNVAVYVRTGAVDCEALTTNAACSATTECRWSEGECVSNWCPTPPTGLPPVCEPCAPTGLQ